MAAPLTGVHPNANKLSFRCTSIQFRERKSVPNNWKMVLLPATENTHWSSFNIYLCFSNVECGVVRHAGVGSEGRAMRSVQ